MKRKLCSMAVLVLVISICSTSVFATSTSKNQTQNDSNLSTVQTKDSVPPLCEENANILSTNYDSNLAKNVAIMEGTVCIESTNVINEIKPQAADQLNGIEYLKLLAQKLEVDITGLTDDEIICKVKEAESKYIYDAPQAVNQVSNMEYFNMVAKKLGVDITGLTDDQIMIKVKQAEAEYSNNTNQVINPISQAQYDAMLKEKEALINK